MLSNPTGIRELSPLLVDSSNPTDTEILQFIRRGESMKIHVWLGSRYAMPPQPKTFLDGTVSTTENSNLVTGSGTSFTSTLKPFDTVQISGSTEVLKVARVDSDTEFVATSEAIYTKSGVTHWIVPDELVTVSEFITAFLLIDFYFAEQASNQDEIELYIARMNKLATLVIEQMANGDYINDTLEEATSANQVNQPSYDASSDLRELIETNDTLFVNSSFIL